MKSKKVRRTKTTYFFRVVESSISTITAAHPKERILDLKGYLLSDAKELAEKFYHERKEKIEKEMWQDVGVNLTAQACIEGHYEDENNSYSLKLLLIELSGKREINEYCLLGKGLTSEAQQEMAVSQCIVGGLILKQIVDNSSIDDK